MPPGGTADGVEHNVLSVEQQVGFDVLIKPQGSGEGVLGCIPWSGPASALSAGVDYVRDHLKYARRHSGSS
jgi:hypothetical protein